MADLVQNWQAWLWSGGILAAAWLITLLVHKVVYSAVLRVSQRTSSVIDDSIARHSRRPAKYILPLLVVFVSVGGLPLPVEFRDGIRHAVALGLIASFAWLIVSLTRVAEDFSAEKFRLDVRDNLSARKIQTQIQVLRRVVVVIVGIVALSMMLMTFPAVRQLGASLLASAGLAGLVVGFAARPALSNLIAGVQIALTEPIRLDDVVIVEGEWGRIEEVTTTYVVVRIWDLRRLVVPLSYFIEHPFQNWTRQTANILGTVFLYADYTVPVEEVRQELRRILESSELWDKQVCVLQVTNATDRTLELRALMSAADSGKAWDLRCQVREKLLRFLQQKHPESLPRTRAEVRGLAAAS